MRKEKKDNWRWTNVFFGKRNLSLLFLALCAVAFLIFGIDIPLDKQNSTASTGVCTDVYSARAMIMGSRRGNKYSYFLRLQDGTEYQIPLRVLRQKTGITFTEIQDECLNQTVTVIHSKEMHWMSGAYELGALKVGDSTIISLEDTSRITRDSNTIGVLAFGFLIAASLGLYCWNVFSSIEYSEWKKKRKILKRKKERQAKSRHG